MSTNNQECIDITRQVLNSELDRVAQQVMEKIKNNIVSLNGKSKKCANLVGFAWELSHDIIHRSYPYQRIPGWYGRVWIRLDNEISGFGSDLFDGTKTYVGSGGAGSYDGPWTNIQKRYVRVFGFHQQNSEYPAPRLLSYTYNFYDNDWPGLEQSFSEEKLISELSQKTSMKNRKHSFEWTSPETVSADLHFIDNIPIIISDNNRPY